MTDRKRTRQATRLSSSTNIADSPDPLLLCTPRKNKDKLPISTTNGEDEGKAKANPKNPFMNLDHSQFAYYHGSDPKRLPISKAEFEPESDPDARATTQRTDNPGGGKSLPNRLSSLEDIKRYDSEINDPVIGLRRSPRHQVSAASTPPRGSSTTPVKSAGLVEGASGTSRNMPDKKGSPAGKNMSTRVSGKRKQDDVQGSRKKTGLEATKATLRKAKGKQKENGPFESLVHTQTASEQKDPSPRTTPGQTPGHHQQSRHSSATSPLSPLPDEVVPVPTPEATRSQRRLTTSSPCPIRFIVSDPTAQQFFEAKAAERAAMDREEADMPSPASSGLSDAPSEDELVEDVRDPLAGLEGEERDLVLKAQDMDDLCPFCSRPMPVEVSKELNRLFNKFQKAGRKASPYARDSFCEMHRVEVRVRTLAAHRGYPRTIDFLQLWQELETPWIRDRVRRLIREPWKSASFRRHIDVIERSSKRAWTAATGQPAMVRDTTPGYYGHLGGAFIQTWLKEDLEATGLIAIDPERTQPLSLAEFRTSVMVPECATMLIMKDRFKWSPASSTETFDAVYQRADQIRVQGMEYGLTLSDDSDASSYITEYNKAKSTRKPIITANWRQDHERRKAAKQQRKLAAMTTTITVEHQATAGRIGIDADHDAIGISASQPITIHESQTSSSPVLASPPPSPRERMADQDTRPQPGVDATAMASQSQDSFGDSFTPFGTQDLAELDKVTTQALHAQAVGS